MAFNDTDYCTGCTQAIINNRFRYNDDPPLQVLSYDDSASQYFDGISFYIDSSYAGVTPKTVDLWPGTYTLETQCYDLFETLILTARSFMKIL